MIGRLTGTVLEKKPPQLLIDVGGVGYELQASMNTFYKLPELGVKVTLHCHMVVREDAQLLYGFHDLSERCLFRTLIKVNGVGPKLALTILSSIDANIFAQCVLDNDAASLVRLPGIGKKTAERLIVEMRDKLADWQETEVVATLGIGATDDIIVRRKATQDAISALIALGYKPQEASKALSGLEAAGKSSETLIREALQGLAA